MINLVDKTIVLAGKTHTGVTFQVWWALEGLGLFATLDDAMKDLNPELANLVNLRPVTMAVAEDGFYK